jgi:hypothetical protein
MKRNKEGADLYLDDGVIYLPFTQLMYKFDFVSLLLFLYSADMRLNEKL